MKGGKIAPVLCNILGTLILASVIVTCLPIVVPRLMGYEVYNVISGSMEPSIPVGSLIYVEAAVPADIQEGEVIAYHGRGSTITHRVVQNRLVEGEFVTKGDANQEEDLNAIPYTSLVGRVKHHIPWVGSFLNIYASGIGRIYVVCFAVCGAMFNMLAGRLRSRAGERARAHRAEADEKAAGGGAEAGAERKPEGDREKLQAEEESISGRTETEAQGKPAGDRGREAERKPLGGGAEAEAQGKPAGDKGRGAERKPLGSGAEAEAQGKPAGDRGRGVERKPLGSGAEAEAQGKPAGGEGEGAQRKPLGGRKAGEEWAES